MGRPRNFHPPKTLDVINPATEAVAGHISMGSATDVDRAVRAARKAFASYSQTAVADRVACWKRDRRIPEALRRHGRGHHRGDGRAGRAGAEGAGCDGHRPPADGAGRAEAVRLQRTARHHADQQGADRRVRPDHALELAVNQIACKVAPALAVGCTMVLKPSEIAPFSAQIWTEILHAAGVPAGVFNLVNGDGPTVGAAIASHPEVDMVSFTGSTRAGIEVARNAAPTVKRVHQELGGKSPNIILPDADLKRAVTGGVRGVMNNSGQSCNARPGCWCPRR
jgi:aldehyde dehydrogenase (NAD+)